MWWTSNVDPSFSEFGELLAQISDLSSIKRLQKPLNLITKMVQVNMLVVFNSCILGVQDIEVGDWIQGWVYNLCTRVRTPTLKYNSSGLTSRTFSPPAVLIKSCFDVSLSNVAIWLLIALSYCWSVIGVLGGGWTGNARSVGSRLSILKSQSWGPGALAVFRCIVRL